MTYPSLSNKTMSNEEKEKYILQNGWEQYGRNTYVKTEWLNESETLGIEPHLCPNWYRTERLDQAYEITLKEEEEDFKNGDDVLYNDGTNRYSYCNTILKVIGTDPLSDDMVYCLVPTLQLVKKLPRETLKKVYTSGPRTYIKA
jgi:hypothetical protein